MTSDELKMSFDPNTIEHLGVQMYSHIPNAIAELIANSYDADAKNVQVKLYEGSTGKKIEVIDNGIGMSFEEINSKFLRIGRNRRKEGATNSPGGRKATGKKGLGKLALFGIGDVIEVITTKKDSGQKISFILNWDQLKSTSGADYKPDFKVQECSKDEQGTIIVLNELRRESPFDKEGLAVSLAKLFNCFDDGFKCFVSLNDDAPIEVNNELKYKNIEVQFEWLFPQTAEKIESDFPNKTKVTGKIISTEKPLKPGLRGLTLFANGRLVNSAEFFGIPESSHVFSYLTGWLNVDFIDELEEDVISTNRQSLNWELPAIAALRDFLALALRRVIVEWREKRKEVSQQTVAEQTNIDTEKWYSTLSGPVKSSVKAIVDSMINETETATEEQVKVIQLVHGLIPEYPDFHWRGLHPEVQKISKAYYESADYYTAVHEAVKRYVNSVRNAIKSTNTKDHSMMGEAFSITGNKLNVIAKYKKPDGTDFQPDTLSNIREGQKSFSESVVQAVRNPIAHEEHGDLKTSGLFSEKDCLDALGLISYIFRRLDDAVEVLPKTAP